MEENNESACKMSFEFVTMSSHTLEIARRLRNSTDADSRLLGETVIDVSELSGETQRLLAQAAKKDGTCDLTPYFDRDMSRAVEAANRLIQSNDSDLRDVSRCVLDQAKAIAASRTSFLDDVRRVSGDEVADKVGRGEWKPEPPSSSPTER